MSKIILALETVIHFYGRQKPLLKHLFLLIPFVNWFFEVCFRWPHFYYKRRLFPFLVAVIATLPFGVFLGWIDFCWRILFGYMIFAKVKRV